MYINEKPDGLRVGCIERESVSYFSSVLRGRAAKQWEDFEEKDGRKEIGTGEVNIICQQLLAQIWNKL